MSWAWKLLLFGGLAYGSVLLAFFFAQTAIIFPARQVQGAGPLPVGGERLVLSVPGGEQLHGVHLAPLRRGAGERPLVLGFAGNAWNAEDAAAFLRGIYPDAHIVTFHYRGYRPSSGKPGAAALQGDALPIHDLVAERFGGRPIVAVGLSIGSGVAAHLASRRPLAGAILVTPFDSLTAVGSGHYPWLPVRLLLRHRMNPAADLRSSTVPIAIIAAARDTLIPAERAGALAAAVRNLVFNRTIAGAGHNDIYQHPAFTQVMGEALRQIETSRRTR
jgi:pimeloyl-ACP methyl ester carboxylesterase